jgi:hypothetical protein
MSVPLSPLARLKLPYLLQNCRMPAADAKWLAEVIISGLQSERVRDRIGTYGVDQATLAVNRLIEPRNP